MPSGILDAVALRIRIVRGFRPGFARSCARSGKAAAGQAAALVRPILLRQEREGLAERSRLAARADAGLAAQPGGRLGRSMQSESVHANYQKGVQVNTNVLLTIVTMTWSIRTVSANLSDVESNPRPHGCLRQSAPSPLRACIRRGRRRPPKGPNAASATTLPPVLQAFL